MSVWSSPLGIAGIVFIVIGLIMAIIGIILLVLDKDVEKPWYIWVLLAGGIVLGIIGGIMLAVAYAREEPKLVSSCYQPQEMQIVTKDACGKPVYHTVKVQPNVIPTSVVTQQPMYVQHEEPVYVEPQHQPPVYVQHKEPVPQTVYVQHPQAPPKTSVLVPSTETRGGVRTTTMVKDTSRVEWDPYIERKEHQPAPIRVVDAETGRVGTYRPDTIVSDVAHPKTVERADLKDPLGREILSTGPTVPLRYAY